MLPSRSEALPTVLMAAAAAQQFDLDRQVAETWALWRQRARRTADRRTA